MQGAPGREVAGGDGAIERDDQVRDDRRKAHEAALAAEHEAGKEVLIARGHDRHVRADRFGQTAHCIVGRGLPAPLLEADDARQAQQGAQHIGGESRAARIHRALEQEQRQRRRLMHALVMLDDHARIGAKRPGEWREYHDGVGSSLRGIPSQRSRCLAALVIDASNDQPPRGDMARHLQYAPLLGVIEHRVLAGVAVDQEPAHAALGKDRAEMLRQRVLVDRPIGPEWANRRGIDAVEVARGRHGLPRHSYAAASACVARPDVSITRSTWATTSGSIGINGGRGSASAISPSFFRPTLMRVCMSTSGGAP